MIFQQSRKNREQPPLWPVLLPALGGGDKVEGEGIFNPDGWHPPLCVVGLAAALGVSRLLSSMIFGVSPYDPLGIGAAALFVLGVAFVAGFLPGRRAVREHPLAALHYE